jgi:NADH dehydrogenase FAD-containing subunit
MTATVIIAGGGYGGTAVAHALDDVADVVLIEPRDTFVHNVATLRAVTDPTLAERIFIPYDGMMSHGRVVRDLVTGVSATGVSLASGSFAAADFVVLATGSSHRYPAKVDVHDAATGRERLLATHRELVRSGRVLLLGAGPVGLEFAGEIAAAFPEKEVTVLDPAPDLVSGRFPERFRAELRSQLSGLGVSLLLGTALDGTPPAPSGKFSPFTVATSSGSSVGADIWFACYGAAPETGYLGGGLVPVTDSLRVEGYENVFAVGDITALPEMKMARQAGRHAEVVAANIRALISGGDLVAYSPEPDAIVLPLGPKGGVTYSPEGGVRGASDTTRIKGDLYIRRFRELLGADA